jgi:hypothetical protein
MAGAARRGTGTSLDGLPGPWVLASGGSLFRAGCRCLVPGHQGAAVQRPFFDELSAQNTLDGGPAKDA